MREPDDWIAEYCTRHFPADPVWVTWINTRFPRIAARLDSLKSAQLEISDHLRSSFETHLAKGLDPETAWKLAQEHFGDPTVITRDVCIARAQSHRCLLIRAFALIVLYLSQFGLHTQVSLGWFLKPEVLLLMIVAAAVGFLITRRRDTASLRRYAFWGAWLGVAWGIFLGITTGHLPTKAGDAISWVLLSTFYGLYLAAPSARGFAHAAMLGLCQFWVLIPLIPLGLVPPHSNGIDAGLVKTGIIVSLFSILLGFVVFDLRNLRRNLTRVAVLGVFMCDCGILTQLRHSITSLDLVVATSIPLFATALFALPLRMIQSRLLHES